MGALSEGYAAGRTVPGRMSAIGAALNQLLSMGFQSGQQEKEMAWKSGEAEKGRTFEAGQAAAGRAGQMAITQEQGAQARQTAVAGAEAKGAEDRATMAQKMSFAAGLATQAMEAGDTELASTLLKHAQKGLKPQPAPGQAAGQAGQPQGVGLGQAPMTMGGPQAQPEAQAGPETPPGYQGPPLRPRQGSPAGVRAQAGFEALGMQTPKGLLREDLPTQVTEADRPRLAFDAARGDQDAWSLLGELDKAQKGAAGREREAKKPDPSTEFNRMWDNYSQAVAKWSSAGRTDVFGGTPATPEAQKTALMSVFYTLDELASAGDPRAQAEFERLFNTLSPEDQKMVRDTQGKQKPAKK